MMDSLKGLLREVMESCKELALCSKTQFKAPSDLLQVYLALYPKDCLYFQRTKDTLREEKKKRFEMLRKIFLMVLAKE